MSNRNKTADVLIVGAGPIGLSAACYLTRLGVSFDIIDAKEGPVTDSRALGVHARTLEFMQMFGLEKAFIEQGRITRFMSFHRFEKLLFKLDFNCIRDQTDFPYMLILPQSRTERILIQHLHKQNVRVKWQAELVAIESEQDINHCQIKIDNQLLEQSYRFVIAADGAGSLVRNQLNIPFEGQTYDARFLLSEANIEDNALARNSSHVFMGKTTTVAVLPQPNSIYRIVGPDFQTKANGHTIVSGTDMSFSAFKNFLERESLLKHVGIRNASRLVNYRIHKRIASSFQRNNVFLCGDAAHIHSPAGGQGMNTGIHDVMNLGWKIAAVLQGSATEELLKSYHQERFPAVKAIIEGADKAMLKVVNRSWWWRLLLDKLAPIVTRWYQPKQLMATMGQLTWSYATNRIETLGRYLEPGQRIPNLSLTNGKTLHQMLGRSARPIMVISGADSAPKTQKERIIQHTRSSVSACDSEYYEVVDPVNIRGRAFVGSLVVRPDGYLLAIAPYLQPVIGSEWIKQMRPEKTLLLHS